MASDILTNSSAVTFYRSMGMYYVGPPASLAVIARAMSVMRTDSTPSLDMQVASSDFTFATCLELGPYT